MTHRLPWPGPRPYTADLSSVFRGRDGELTHLLNLLQGQKLTLMTASSGAGKTSLLQAGLIPRIREFRLTERGGELARQPVAPFPIIVNQWLERAGKGDVIDISHLLALEIHRYLRESIEWYVHCRDSTDKGTPDDLGVKAEIEAIDSALDALATLAGTVGFARREDAALRSPLVWQSPGEGQVRSTSREITDSLMAVLDSVRPYLGDVLLILDQFEEILLDWRLGLEAQGAVESIYRLRGNEVRQLISMRDDGLHLFDELLTKGLLEPKRRLKIQPLDKAAIEEIVRDVSLDDGHAWDVARMPDGSDLLARLVESFAQTKTGGGTRAGEVNLVGLQVVLNAVFQDWLSEGEAVTAKTLTEYCESLTPEGGAAMTLAEWLDDGHLAYHAPLSWIARCLGEGIDADSTTIVDNVFELQIQPLAARMSWLLMTPAGNKRTMTASELHDYAYREDTDGLDPHDLAGKAAEGAGDPESAWSIDDYTLVMGATCDEALDRLTRGNVLKRRGSETGRDIAYELVHDQFGKPFQAWADRFKATPENDLNSLRAIKSTKFNWSGELRPHDDDGIIPWAKWLDCTLNDVDLSNLKFAHCDFGESIFNGCTFNNAVFEDCDLTNAIFKGCSFDKVKFVRSEMSSTRWIGGTSLRSVQVIEGGADVGMSFAQLSNAMLTDCRFCVAAEENDAPVSERNLPMQYVQFIDCGFAGEVEFDHCSLDTMVVKGLGGPCRVDGTMRFVDCSMPGSELSNLDVRGSTLNMSGCDCRAAAFVTINAGSDENGGRSFVGFSNVVLIGAAMVDCTLDGVAFTGPLDTQDGRQRGPASAFTIRGRPDSETPCRIANVSFKGLQADNLSIEGCEIDGDLSFEDCILTGAEIVGYGGGKMASEAREIGGSITFKSGCDVSATKFAGLRFSAAHMLEMSDCVARGTLFSDVAFLGDSLVRPAAVFHCSDLGGASFIGSELRGARFSGLVDEAGRPQTPMPSLVVLRGGGGTTLRPALAQVAFENMLMPGFVCRDVAIDGDVTFKNCDLGGGGITQTDDGQSTRLSVKGDLCFENCVMDAIEFSRLEFHDEPLRIAGCDCKGALFNKLAFLSEGEQDNGLLVDRSDLSGALFLDCQISHSRLMGDSSKHRSEALSVSFRETPGHSASLSDLVVQDYDLDGATFQGVAVKGSLVFRGCSLLRAKFSDLAIEADAILDLTRSDLLYAEVDPQLIEDKARFRITGEQRKAILAQREHEDILRLGSRSTGVE